MNVYVLHRLSRLPTPLTCVNLPKELYGVKNRIAPFNLLFLQ
jgi:hypothetical protein